MPATKRPRSTKRVKRVYGEESRKLILITASRLFARKGLEATSMSDIAEQAGVSRATVFNQFRSKSLVLDAITAGSLEVYCGRLARALADEETPTPELVRRLYKEIARGLEDNRALHREIFVEIQKASMGLGGDGEVSRLRRKAFDLLAAMFRRGQTRGELTRAKPAEVLATAFDGMLSGAIMQWLNASKAVPLHPLLAALADTLLAGAAVRD